MRDNRNKNNESKFHPDFFWRVILHLVRWRAGMPGWRLETMACLVLAEAEGVAMIEEVLPRVADKTLRTLLEKHRQDEIRHMQSFIECYERIKGHGKIAAEPLMRDNKIQKFDVLTLIAYLEKQEARAIPILELYTELYAGDDETVDVIRKNIKDEKFHAKWTSHQLEKWIIEGRAEEVRLVRREANSMDRKAFWLQLGAFIKAMPLLISRGVLPSFFNHKPAPMH